MSSRKKRNSLAFDIVEEVAAEPVNPLYKLRKNKKFKFTPKNQSQEKFIKEIENKNIVFNIGSAGTGKSYVSVCWAIEQITKRDSIYKRLVFTRPAIEACGEEIGFLPGLLEEKLAPYMQPIYDILFKYGIYKNDIAKLIEEGIIEICPLAFMRGRSFEGIILIAEECQNMSSSQMEMLLTRIGKDSKFILTGDTSQRDIRTAYGVEEAYELFRDCNDIGFVVFDSSETLRDPLVEYVVDKYADLRENQTKNKKTR